MEKPEQEKGRGEKARVPKRCDSKKLTRVCTAEGKGYFEKAKKFKEGIDKKEKEW